MLKNATHTTRSSSLFMVFILVISSAFIFQGCKSEGSSNDTGQNVILLTLDGVRWQEVFQGTDPNLSSSGQKEPLFQNLFKITKDGLRIGNQKLGSVATVSNTVRISLPAYQSILTGAVTPCYSNSCPRVSIETVQESILRNLNLSKDKIATFASWKLIERAAEHQANQTYVNTGATPYEDFPVISENPWNDSSVRMDRYTIEYAFDYLKKHQPRFLYISLNDSDSSAHSGDYEQYINALKNYDLWIGQLRDLLNEMPEYGSKTTIIVTTDHGRGDGSDWTSHGPTTEGAQYIWIFAVNPKVSNRGATTKTPYTHLNLRPTIERILGVQASSVKDPIQELIPADSFTTSQEAYRP